MSHCDDPRLHAYAVTLEVVGHLNRIFDRSLRERCGMSQTSFEALFRLERAGGEMTMGDLAAELALTSGGVTRLVDRLGEEGFAERRSCPEDRRVQYATITGAGRTKFAEAMEVHLFDLDEHFFAHMSGADRELLVSTMERVRDAVGRRAPATAS